MSPMLIGDRHVFRKLPKAKRGLTWGRKYDPDTGMVSYTLFMRDSERRLYCEQQSFHASMRFDGTGPRPQIARCLRGMRAQLRWRIDQIEFARLGLVDTTPAPETRHRETSFPPKNPGFRCWPAPSLKDGP